MSICGQQKNRHLPASSRHSASGYEEGQDASFDIGALPSYTFGGTLHEQTVACEELVGVRSRALTDIDGAWRTLQVGVVVAPGCVRLHW